MAAVLAFECQEQNSHGLADSVHASEAVFESLKNRFAFRERGEIELRGLGLARTYILIGPA